MDKQFNTITSIILFIVLFASCSTYQKIDIPVVNENELDRLQEMMTGSYDSSEQAVLDSTYYNISLHMYPIWENRKDGSKYLYVEQALASMQEKPYRQRVYRLEQLGNGTIASHIYTLKFDSLFIGKWMEPDYFSKFGLSVLDIREGCEVTLTKNSSGYQGSTQEDNCKSTLRGASYATSIVSISSKEITSWDQGFNDKDEQVWGATEGPYKFIKLMDKKE